jgi:hypothetical protein
MMQRNTNERGSSFIAMMIIVSALGVAGMTYLNSSSNVIRGANRKASEVKLTQICDAGGQAALRSYWRTFRQNQNFNSLDTLGSTASENNPTGVVSGSVTGVGRYSAGIVWFRRPEGDSYTRQVTIRVAGWIDKNNNGLMDVNEAVKVVDIRSSFQLTRSQVFDYTYFVNNYGWMSGFGQNDLVVNGDMRANGDFSFTSGTPTVNGTIIATANEKLGSGAAGLITGLPVKWNNDSYNSASAGGSADNEARWRQGYSESKYGAKTASSYLNIRDVLFDTLAEIQSDRIVGSSILDSDGARSWVKENANVTPTVTTLDTAASQEVIMPDLSDISDYQALSSGYIDNLATFKDGTPNPNAGQGAWVEVWDSATSTYNRISVNGYVNGSAVLVGTEANPIRIHGPVTFAQDVVIKGTVQGQGTLYSGRNVHIVGSLRYKNKPDFRGNNATVIDQRNQKADLLGLAARGSVIMGNPSTFNDLTLGYMSPPFTKSRKDDNGNVVPAFNGTETDSTGRMRYQSVISDEVMNTISEGINQIDAVIYTNFLGGGNLGTSGGGLTINGSIISRDEAMVVWSLPMRMNYDTRIRERASDQKPLIDIKLPRSPVLLRSSWQDRGVSYGY